MKKRVLFVCWVLISFFLTSSIVDARVYSIIDYKDNLATRDTSTQKDTGHTPDPVVPDRSSTCANEGGVDMIYLAPQHVCKNEFTLNDGTRCCASYACSAEYMYNSLNCMGENVELSGASCTDSDNNTYYTGCGCKPEYNKTAETCGEFGVDINSGSCTYNNQTYYKSCLNPCDDEDNVVNCKAEFCSYICSEGTCLKDKCKEKCPMFYSTTVAGCSSSGLSLPSNASYALGSKTNGMENGQTCYECTYNCKTGYIKDANGMCSTCPSGHYEQDGICKECKAGTYAAAGAKSCTICPANTYSAAGAASCTKCGMGEYSSQGSAECKKCPAGTYLSANTCVLCPAGTYSKIAGVIFCTPCPVGRYSNTDGATSCKSCSAGTYAANKGSTSCTQCPSGQYSNGTGMSQCKVCPEGEQVNSTQSGCERKATFRCTSFVCDVGVRELPDGTCECCTGGDNCMMKDLSNKLYKEPLLPGVAPRDRK